VIARAQRRKKTADFREEVERGRGRFPGRCLDMVQNPFSRLSCGRYSSVVSVDRSLLEGDHAGGETGRRWNGGLLEHAKSSREILQLTCVRVPPSRYGNFLIPWHME
jgi:hypothetical protein